MPIKVTRMQFENLSLHFAPIKSNPIKIKTLDVPPRLILIDIKS